MGGEDHRSPGRPTGGRPYDETDASASRARRWKPPPGIITAGGVDMARGHASNVVVREAPAPSSPVDEPRVVIALENDPRKVPTHRRLLEGRDAARSGPDGARPALLPSAVSPAAIGRDPPSVSSQQTTQPSARLPSALGRPQAEAGTEAAAPGDPTARAGAPSRAETSTAWLRTLLIVIVVGVAGGTALRLRAQRTEHVDMRPLHTAHVSLPLIEPDATTMELQAPPSTAGLPGPSGPATATPATPAAQLEATATAAPPPPPPAPPPAPNVEPPRHAARVSAGKPAFTPPFQLPFEKIDRRAP